MTDAWPPRGFTRSEYARRSRALQTRMRLQGMDALLLTGAADIAYVTGFVTRFWESPARPWFVLIPAQGEPIAVIPTIGEALMRKGWLTDIRTWNAPDPVDDGVSLLGQAICECVPPSGRLGMPMGLETQLRMPLGDWQRVWADCAPRALVDATDVVQRTREIKSEAEIDKLRAVCAVGDRAFARLPEVARSGTPLAQVFRDFQCLLLQAGADWVSYTAGGAGADGYDDVISPADERPLQAGDVLMLDTGAVRDGYFCDFDRNFAISHACDEVHRTHKALHAATDAALAMLRPGVSASDVHATLTAHLRRAGMTPGEGRLGHGLGITLTEWPSFTERDHTPLRANMVLTLEPGAVMANGRILVHEENLVLREHGAELLSTRAPAEIPVLR